MTEQTRKSRKWPIIVAVVVFAAIVAFVVNMVISP